MSGLIILYEQAMKLLPLAYRERYAKPMVQTLEDMLADQPTALAKGKVWFRALFDLSVTTAYQYAQIGGTTMNQAPHYAKRGVLLSAALLVPFFVLVSINTVHPLTVSWREVGYFGVFILPVIALLIDVITLGRLLVSKDLLARLKGVKRLQANWLLFAVPLLALMIVGFAFGHDTVHCVTAGNSHQIMECVSRG